MRCRAFNLGALPLSLPFARAIAIPSRVRIRKRSTSNSAKVARMLKNILPIGSVGLALALLEAETLDEADAYAAAEMPIPPSAAIASTELTGV